MSGPDNKSLEHKNRENHPIIGDFLSILKIIHINKREFFRGECLKPCCKCCISEILWLCGFSIHNEVQCFLGRKFGKIQQSPAMPLKNIQNSVKCKSEPRASVTHLLQLKMRFDSTLQGQRIRMCKVLS